MTSNGVTEGGSSHVGKGSLQPRRSPSHSRTVSSVHDSATCCMRFHISALFGERVRLVPFLMRGTLHCEWRPMARSGVPMESGPRDAPVLYRLCRAEKSGR